MELDEIEGVLAAAVQWKCCRVAAMENVTPQTFSDLAHAEATLSAAVTAYALKHIFPEGKPNA